MRYTQESLLAEIMDRGRRIRRTQERMKTAVLSAATLFVAALLAGSYARFTESVVSENPQTRYGALLLPGAAGGFVLAAVIAFAAGVTVTLLCVRRRKKDAEAFRDRDAKEGSGHETES